ncbi:PH domain-containing protein [Thalassorhabdus alkalitolerans]|uniref:PH domain-containing protein n=1 Tax=Thalassorhabdus alkalitolerans TaxID=2282697 RepID=A0ABW0YW74_9BACI|nr:PH domain-containing protein [Thalassobacillus sp. C254]
MRKEPTQRISRKALPVWRFKGALESLFFLSIPVFYGILMYFYDFPQWLLWVFIGLYGILFLFFVWVIPSVRWRRWRYEVHEQEIDLKYGVFIVRRTLIPMIRVQHVDTEQGPLYRRYGLSAVTISTAADVHEIPALTEEVADNLRDQIAMLAQTADEDE